MVDVFEVQYPRNSILGMVKAYRLLTGHKLSRGHIRYHGKDQRDAMRRIIADFWNMYNILCEDPRRQVLDTRSGRYYIINIDTY
jgi:hypothetical protein